MNAVSLIMAKHTRLESLCEKVTVGHVGTTAKHYRDEGVPFLRTQNVGANGLKLDDLKFITADFHASQKKSQVQSGDILVSRVVTDRVNCGVVPANIGQANCANVLLVRPSANKICTAYLHHYLRSSLAQEHLLGQRVGAAQQVVNTKVLRELPIPLPPLEEQKRIAGILDQADALRRLRTRALDKLNTLGQAIFHEMFGEIGRSSLPTHQFGDFAEIKLGKMLDRGKFKGGETKPYLRNVNVRWFHIDISDVFEMEFAEKEKERFRVRKGDLLICEGGEPGRCAIWTDENAEIYYQKALHRVRLDQNVALPDYVAFWFFIAAKTGKLSDFISTATIAHLTGAKIKQLPIMLPAIADQRLFVGRLERIEENRVVLVNQLRAHETLFASFQHRAFRGEL